MPPITVKRDNTITRLPDLAIPPTYKHYSPSLPHELKLYSTNFLLLILPDGSASIVSYLALSIIARSTGSNGTINGPDQASSAQVLHHSKALMSRAKIKIKNKK